MAVNVEEAGQGFLDFYRLGEGMVMTKAETGWEIDNNDNTMSFPEMVWMISEKKTLAGSDEMVLQLPGKEEETISGYLEITWPDQAFVQVANNDLMYQTVTTDARIIFKNGAILDLGERALVDGEGNTYFTLSELYADMQEGAISIQSSSASDWQPPEFNIQVENGVDGADGKSGENGELGESGENGVDGVNGESGESGANGQAGAAGSAGKKGGSGGTAGSSGTGSSGSGGSSGTVSGLSNRLASMRVESMSYNSTSAELTVLVEDEFSTLQSNTGIVEIRETSTNKLVVTSKENFAESDIHSFSFQDVLLPDRQYTLIVKSDYSVELQNGVQNTGTKTFIKRDFFTNSEGITMALDRTETDKVYVSLNELDTGSGFTKPTDFMMRITSGEYWVTYPYSTGGSVSSQKISSVAGGVTLDFVNDLFGKKYASEGLNWSSDIPYTIELYTASSSGTWSLNSEGIPEDALAYGTVKQSAQTLSGRTLKEKPEIGAVYSTLTNDGYYDLTVSVDSDKDQSIKSYEFTIKNNYGETVRTISSTTNSAKWYYEGDITPNTTYSVSCEVTYYDNEKDVILGAQTGTDIVVTATGNPVVRFFPYTQSTDSSGNAVWVDSQGNTVNSYNENFGTTGVNATRIWGDVLLNMNGKTLDTSSNLTVKITSNTTYAASGDYNTSYDRTLSYSPAELKTGKDGEYYFPLKCLGLRAGTVYVISVTGTVETQISVGGATQIQKSSKLLGSASVKTNDLNGESIAAVDSVAGFTITSMVNDETNPGMIARLSLFHDEGSYSYINSTSPDSDYYFERSIARAIAVEIWNETESEQIGSTIVLDMYEPQYQYNGNYDLDKGDWQTSNGISDAERVFFKGPLVANNTADDYFYISEDDLKSHGINLTAGKIIVKAVALYDYAYNLREDSRRLLSGLSNYDPLSYNIYDNCFVEPSVQNYNTMKLNPIDIIIGGTISQTLNYQMVDLGEERPELIDPPQNAVTVTEIKNTYNNAVRYTDPLLKEDTTVGLKVQSNYANVNKDTTSISYYCMTMDAYHEYTQNYASSEDKDIIQAWRAGNPNADIKFSITLEMTGSNAFSTPADANVPPLYVVFTEDEELLSKCRTDVTDTDGNIVTRYNAVPDQYGQAVFYTDLIGRGHCYVFAFTLLSMYHVNAELGVNPEPWEFPYEINSKVSTISYNYTKMQRSSGTDVYREVPQAAVYLDYTMNIGIGSDTKDAAFWKYVTYDPDGALDDKLNKPGSTNAGENYAGKVIAGSSTTILSELSSWLKNGRGLTGTQAQSLLKTAKISEYSGQQPSGSGADNTETDKLLERSFFLNMTSINKEKAYKKLEKFTVTVDDNAGTADNPNVSTYARLANRNYEIWLSYQLFDDKFCHDENEYLTVQMDTQGLTELQADYFALPTAKHEFDSMGGLPESNIEALEFKVSLPTGSDNLLISEPDTVTGGTNRITGFYYELYKLEEGAAEVPEDAEAIQTGFRPYSATVQIPLTEPKPGDTIAVKLWAVYDTGKAGVNLDRLKSSIHALPEKIDIQNTEADKKEGDNYFAIQQQNNNTLYATDSRYNSSRRARIPYYSNTRSSSLFFVGKKTTATGTTSNRVYGAQMWDGGTQLELDFGYSPIGGYVGDYLEDALSEMNMPIFKQLAETPVKLVKQGDAVSPIKQITADGKTYSLVKTTVPATRPNIDEFGINSRNLYSTDVYFHFTQKSMETLYNKVDEYEPEIYLKLYQHDDSGNEIKVRNTDNRYFAVINDDDVGKYDNPKRKEEGDDIPVILQPKRTNTDDDKDDKGNIIYEFDLDYKIALRNLEPGSTYYFKMYCIKKKGTREEETVPVLNNTPSLEVSDFGEPVNIQVVTSSRVSIGESGSVTSTKLAAEFIRNSYEEVALNVSYSLSLIKDYYIEYRIVDTQTGNIIFNNQDMMSAIGYPFADSTVRTFWYYKTDSTGNGKWKSHDYCVYYKNGNSFQPASKSAANPETFVFRGTELMNKFVQGHTYKLEVNLFNLYDTGLVGTNEDGWIQINYALDTVQGNVNEPPSVTFTVPNRAPIHPATRVNYTAATTGSKAELTVFVTDEGFKLGVYKEGATELSMGQYKLILKRKDSSGTEHIMRLGADTEITQENVFSVFNTGGDFKGGDGVIFNKTESFALNYLVKDNESYTVEIWGVDVDQPNIPTENTLLYTETYVITDLDLPRITEENTAYEYDNGKIIISVSNGLNLDKVTAVVWTLRNTSKSPNPYVTLKENAEFVQDSGDPKWQELVIDLRSVLDDWVSKGDLETGNSITLSVQFYNGDTILQGVTATTTRRYRG